MRERREETPPSSRLFVKNVPRHATEEALRAHFNKLGGSAVTDVRILRNERHESRRVAFVGFPDESAAARARAFFDKTFMDTSKLEVSFALPIGDAFLEEKKRRLASKASSSSSSPDSKTIGKDDDNYRKEKRAILESIKDRKPVSEKHKEFLELMGGLKTDNNKSKSATTNAFWSDEEDEGTNDNPDSSSEGEDEDAKDVTSLVGSSSTQKQENGNSGGEKTTRLFVRNLAFQATEEEVRTLFTCGGKYRVESVVLPLDESQRPKGYGIVTFTTSEECEAARKALDGHAFSGRVMHVIPGRPAPNSSKKSQIGSEPGAGNAGTTSYKTARDEERRKAVASGADEKTWHALFVRADAAVGAVAAALGASKAELLNLRGEKEGGADTPAVRAAMSEARVVEENKAFLASEGVDLEALHAILTRTSSSSSSSSSSSTSSPPTGVLLVKNLPSTASETDLRPAFAKCGTLDRFVMPPSRTMALVSYVEPAAAKKAFESLAYTRYRQVPLYIQSVPRTLLARGSVVATTSNVKDAGMSGAPTRIIYVKNLPFEATKEELTAHLARNPAGVAPQHVAIVTRERKGKTVSAGYGFAQFATPEDAAYVMNQFQGSDFRGHTLGMEFSDPATLENGVSSSRGGGGGGKKVSSTKLLVKNLAFEATKREVKKLFNAYGEVKRVRMPKRHDGAVRGFAFVEFTSSSEAKRAFEALAAAHFYGRHLVIEYAGAEDGDEAEMEEDVKRLGSEETAALKAVNVLSAVERETSAKRRRIGM